ncbi:MAG: hypothetical protein ACLQDV_06075 [Candidatus Binataceae bacterium]
MMNRNSHSPVAIPSLDRIATDPGCASGLPRATVTALLRRVAVAQSALCAELDGSFTADYREDTVSPAALDGGTWYLSTKQLTARIPYAEKTLRNLILKGELIEGLHFFKRRGRVMFSWSAMRDWVEKRSVAETEVIPLVRNRNGGSR